MRDEPNGAPSWRLTSTKYVLILTELALTQRAKGGPSAVLLEHLRDVAVRAVTQMRSGRFERASHAWSDVGGRSGPRAGEEQLHEMGKQIAASAGRRRWELGLRRASLDGHEERQGLLASRRWHDARIVFLTCRAWSR